MFGRKVATWWVLAAVLLAGAPPVRGDPASPGDDRRYAGRSLTEALLDLQARGLEVLFTSQVVVPEMRVETEPDAGSLRSILDQLLEPHGLESRQGPGGKLVVVPRPATAASVRGVVRGRYDSRPLTRVQFLIQGTGLEATSDADGGFELDEVPPGTYTLEARRPGFVVERMHDVEVRPGRVTEVLFELVPAPVPIDEIVVTPSLISLLRSDPVARIALERDEIAALPHLGDDLFRALTLLPGTSGGEFSARFNVRGGRADEVLVRLDQLELFDPYHIKDFSGSLSFIAPQAIAEMDLILGGFPAPFGDRMGGVLDMRTVEPAESRRHLGIALLGAQAGGSGRFHDDRGQWLGVARYGSLELAREVVGQEVQPRYWDAFGKVELDLGERHRLGLRLLHADDTLATDIIEDGDREQVGTDYRSSYLWLTHRRLARSDLVIDSVVSFGRIDRDRGAIERVEDELEFEVRDVRELRFVGFKQDWSLALTDRHYLRWGADGRRLDADYEYRNEFEPDGLLDAIRGGPVPGTTDFRGEFRGEQIGVYVSDRLKLWRQLTAELGLRYDEHTVPGDRDLSPRVNLVTPLGEASTLRLAWGHYFQSQRLYELQVEDGETGFFPSELTEQVGFGYERLFDAGSTLRLELYHRDIINPRPRYVNLYEPIDSFPEVQPDRFRITPERSRAQGLEVFFRGRPGKKVDWWLNYTWSRVRDEIGGRDVPRGFDQPHTLNADLNVRISEHWSLNLAFRFHTGWPTTAVSGALEPNDDGELEPVLLFGPRNGARLADYHRLDLRASRVWRLRKGELSFFFDVQNLYDRENQAGFDVEITPTVEEGRVVVTPIEETWAGILPSFGLDWRF